MLIKKNIYIVAENIVFGKNVTFGNNINIRLHGNFFVKEYSNLGNNVSIGKHFYHSSGLKIGGGGSQNFESNLIIGDRCVIHNSFINIASSVTIGNDVGFSNDVDIMTHGFWGSVLQGYPASFQGVTIGNNVIVGFKSSFLMGANVCDNIVIGAHSLITKNISKPGIYAGSPIKFIRSIEALSYHEKFNKFEEIMIEYDKIAKFRDVKYKLSTHYPWIHFNELKLNVETFEFKGVEDTNSDDFRDFLRKWGIRIYTSRPFKSKRNPPD